MLDERQRLDRQNLTRELTRFRQNYQRKSDSREYDLECSQRQIASIGSCLIFEGEDLHRRDRQMHEQRQMKRWLEEQVCNDETV